MFLPAKEPISQPVGGWGQWAQTHRPHRVPCHPEAACLTGQCDGLLKTWLWRLLGDNTVWGWDSRGRDGSDLSYPDDTPPVQALPTITALRGLDVRVLEGGGFLPGTHEESINPGHLGVLVPEDQQAKRGDCTAGVTCPFRWEPVVTPRWG